MLGSNQHFQRLGARFVIPRRYLVEAKRIDQDETFATDAIATPFMTRRREWTSEEDGIIDRAIQGGLTWRQCVELLPSTRTPFGIQRKFRSRKRILRSQSGDEDDRSEQVKMIIKLAASGLTPSQIRLALPHLTQDTIHSIAWYHGFKMERSNQDRGRRWSASEDDVIRQELRKGVPDSLSLAKFLPGRTPDAIERRARYLRSARLSVATATKKCARWTPAEDAKLMSEYTRAVPLVKIAEMLSRTYSSIEQRVVKRLREQNMTPDGRKSEGKA
jgi:hypothetical protein